MLFKKFYIDKKLLKETFIKKLIFYWWVKNVYRKYFNKYIIEKQKNKKYVDKKIINQNKEKINKKIFHLKTVVLKQNRFFK